MPCINLPIEPIGPVLEVGVASATSLLAENAPPPAIQWFKAIADTGCSHTSIHSSVAVKCGLKVMGKNYAATPAGVVAINIFHGDMFLRALIDWQTPVEWKFQDRPFCELMYQDPAFDILLGMDILSLGLFSTNGGLKQAAFCW